MSKLRDERAGKRGLITKYSFTSRGEGECLGGGGDELKGDGKDGEGVGERVGKVTEKKVFKPEGEEGRRKDRPGQKEVRRWSANGPGAGVGRGVGHPHSREGDSWGLWEASEKVPHYSKCSAEAGKGGGEGSRASAEKTGMPAFCRKKQK